MNCTRLGYVRVAEVSGRISKAVPLMTFAAAPAIGSVVRAASEEEVKELARAQKRK